MDEAPQQLLFAESGSDADPLWSAWLATSEAGRRRFLERVRQHFLFGVRKVGRATGGGDPVGPKTISRLSGINLDEISYMG